jgi:hypothetical protein
VLGAGLLPDNTAVIPLINGSSVGLGWTGIW